MYQYHNSIDHIRILHYIYMGGFWVIRYLGDPKGDHNFDNHPFRYLYPSPPAQGGWTPPALAASGLGAALGQAFVEQTTAVSYEEWGSV